MHEHINKGAKMQTKQRKPNKMAQSKYSGLKGSKACYQTKEMGKHVKKAQKKANMRNPNMKS